MCRYMQHQWYRPEPCWGCRRITSVLVHIMQGVIDTCRMLVYLVVADTLSIMACCYRQEQTLGHFAFQPYTRLSRRSTSAAKLCSPSWQSVNITRLLSRLDCNNNNNNNNNNINNNNNVCEVLEAYYLPQYLVDSVQSVAESSRRLGLRSANTADYVNRCTRTKFGERCFSHAGPAAWNSLPASIKLTTDTSRFEKKKSKMSPVSHSILTFCWCPWTVCKSCSTNSYLYLCLYFCR